VTQATNHRSGFGDFYNNVKQFDRPVDEPGKSLLTLRKMMFLGSEWLITYANYLIDFHLDTVLHAAPLKQPEPVKITNPVSEQL
jgi:hypothetical protein